MTARFCTQCGERLEAKRSSSLPFRAFCARCSPRSSHLHLALIAVPILCVAFGFIAGRYASKREPFYFIGSPIEMSGIATSSTDNQDHSTLPALGQEQLVISPSTLETICGARTKSGKPCQRKVKSGGYCWQHRDKFSEKKSAPPKR